MEWHFIFSTCHYEENTKNDNKPATKQQSVIKNNEIYSWTEKRSSTPTQNERQKLGKLAQKQLPEANHPKIRLNIMEIGLNWIGLGLQFHMHTSAISNMT